jgi:protein-S-isoprenylcysteine O-methyltransferase Ste14
MHAYFSGDMIVKYLVILFAYAWGVVEIFQQIKQRKQRRETVASQDRGSLIFLYICITLGYSIAIPISFSPYGRLDWGHPYWLVCGMVLIVSGLVIRYSAMQTLASYFTYAVEIQAQQRLVETGLYRYIRHPGYLGQLMVFLGIGLALANWITVLVLFVPVVVAFSRRIRVEEEALQAHFAEQFEAYRKRSWRMIPWLY